LTGRLRLCAAVTFGCLHVIPWLSIFLAKHPALGVDVVPQAGDIDLIGAGIDVVLHISPLRDSALTARKIA
jgi:DNA-binding transcriptional LysR family regulator